MRRRKSWEDAIFEVVIGVLVLGIAALIIGFFVVMWQESHWAVVGILAFLALAVGATVANHYWSYWWNDNDWDDD